MMHRHLQKMVQAGSEALWTLFSSDRITFYDAEKASYIDSWNYDAVNWYSKSDQLAVQDALENQLIAVDVVGF
jgi:hypothetical protein